MTKTELIARIKRNFGWPLVKVELNDDHITDAIDYATSTWKRWATGAATQEVYYTMALSAGQYLYEMPVGTTDVLSYDTSGVSSGINTLFTIENYMYSQGLFDGLINASSGFDLVSYHIARDFLDTVRRYTPDAYNFKYHRYANLLEIQPPPPSGGSLTYTPKYKSEAGVEVLGDEITIDSPGWILLRIMMLQGSSYSLSFTEEDINEQFYSYIHWILDFATAYSKKTLGQVRRKFAGFGSLGNQGIALDGGELISEADQEMERLLENLKKEEAEVGYGILIG